MTQRIGQQIGNYLLTRFLGRGGFGEVYLGEHQYLKTMAAVKILHGEVVPHDFQEFVREAQIIASLKHPYILRVLDFGMDEQFPYLVMDYAPLGSLRDRYPRGTLLPLPAIMTYIKQVASALQYAHEAHLIHCDIKPENILAASEQYILLTDFGIATIAQNTGALQMLDPAGTPPYMAPEQFQGKPQSASDQYSLAIVAYEWLCGQRPFGGNSFAEVGLQHMNTPLPSLREKNPQILPAVEQVVGTALSKDPQQRFATVQAFADAFEQACQAAIVTDTLVLEQSGKHFSAADTVRPVASWGETRVIPELHHPNAPAFYTQATEPIELPPAKMIQMSEQFPGGQVADTVRPVSPVSPVPATWGKLVQTYQGHLGGAQVLVGAPDGRYMASGAIDGAVHVWEIETGERIYSYTQHRGAIQALAWSPDGKYLASGGVDQTIQVWEVLTGKRLHTYTGHAGPVVVLAWSFDGHSLASGSEDKTVQVWEALKGVRLQTLTSYTDRVRALAWSPDNQRLAVSTSDKTVQIWHAFNGTLFSTYTGHTNYVNALAWAPAGEYVASGSWDRTVQVWEPTMGTCFCTYTGHSFLVQALAWSPDGRQIVSADTSVRVWEALTGAEICVYSGQSDRVHALVWQPDGQDILLTDDQHILRWSVPGGEVQAEYQGHLARVNAVVWSPDGQYMASIAEDRELHVWEAATGKLVHVYAGHVGRVNCIAWSPDGRFMVSGGADQTIQLWEPLTGTRVEVYTGQSSNGQANPVTAVAWSPDGQYIATGYTNGTVQVQVAGAGKRVSTYIGHARDVSSLSWSPNGQYIASGSSGQIQVWEALTGKRIAAHDHDPFVVTAVVWSPDGRSLAYSTVSVLSTFGLFTRAASTTGRTGGVQVWNLMMATHMPVQMGDASAVVWSPDGLYVASPERTVVQIREARTGKPVYSYHGHAQEEAVTVLAWSPDGKQIASGGYGVQVWQVS